MATFDCGGTSVSGPSATITGWGSGKVSVTYTDESGKQSYKSINLSNPTESEKNLLSASGYYTTDSKGNVHGSVTGLSAVRGQQISIIPTGTEAGSSKPTYEVNPAYSVQSAQVTGWNGTNVSVKTTDAFGREQYRTINTANAKGEDAAILNSIADKAQTTIKPNGGNASTFSSIKGQEIAYVKPAVSSNTQMTTTPLSSMSSIGSNASKNYSYELQENLYDPSQTGQIKVYDDGTITNAATSYTRGVDKNGNFVVAGKDKNGKTVFTEKVTDVVSLGGNKYKYKNPVTNQWSVMTVDAGSKTSQAVDNLIAGKASSVGGGLQSNITPLTNHMNTLNNTTNGTVMNTISTIGKANNDQKNLTVDNKVKYTDPGTEINGNWSTKTNQNGQKVAIFEDANGTKTVASKFKIASGKDGVYYVAYDAAGKQIGEKIPVTEMYKSEDGGAKAVYDVVNPFTGKTTTVSVDYGSKANQNFENKFNELYGYGNGQLEDDNTPGFTGTTAGPYGDTLNWKDDQFVPPTGDSSSVYNQGSNNSSIYSGGTDATGQYVPPLYGNSDNNGTNPNSNNFTGTTTGPYNDTLNWQNGQYVPPTGNDASNYTGTSTGPYGDTLNWQNGQYIPPTGNTGYQDPTMYGGMNPGYQGYNDGSFNSTLNPNVSYNTAGMYNNIDNVVNYDIPVTNPVGGIPTLDMDAVYADAGNYWNSQGFNSNRQQ